MKQSSAFFLCVIEAMLTVFLLGYDVKLYGYMYITKCCVLLSYRLIEYRRTGLHYFMWEFCYYGTILSALFFLCLENALIEDMDIFRGIYSLAHGPLLFAAVTLGDKIVFHDVQYMTSLFIHLGPAMFTWALRWKPESYHYYPMLDRTNIIQPYMHLTEGLKLYVLWYVPYVLLMFVLLRNRIETRGYDTMYQYFFRQHQTLAIMDDSMLRKILYMIFHLSVAAVAIGASSIWYSSFILNTGLILGVSILTTYRASTYYAYKYKDK